MTSTGQPCTTDLLVVSTRLLWLTDDFCKGADGRFPVIAEGFDAVLVDPETVTAWWTPTVWAQRMRNTGTVLHLLSPGPTWLTRVPERHLRRTVWAGTVEQAGNAPKQGFCKPAEAKIDRFEPGWWDDTSRRVEQLHNIVPAQTWIQISDRLLDIREEHRCYILNGQVVTTSPYRTADGQTWEPGWETSPHFAHNQARQFAQTVADDMGTDQPPGYTLDVAHTTDGWAVIEANPAWSSGTYGCDMTRVVDTVCASSITNQNQPAPTAWAWEPDPWIVADAARRPTLKTRHIHPDEIK